MPAPLPQTPQERAQQLNYLKDWLFSPDAGLLRHLFLQPAARMAERTQQAMQGQFLPPEQYGQTMLDVAALSAPGIAAAPEEAALGVGIRAIPARAADEAGAAVTAPFPQYAYQYPPSPEPQLFVKESLAGGKKGYGKPEPWPVDVTPKKAAKLVSQGQAYWGRGELGPDAAAFKKARTKVMAEMEADPNYPRFFGDPAYRASIQPGEYSMAGDTTVAAQPATAAKRAEFEAKFNTQDVRDRLGDLFEKGKSYPDSSGWYFLKQADDFIRSRVGDEQGKEFMRDFAGRMAATTAGQQPTGNMLMAHFVAHAKQAGIDVGDIAQTSLGRSQLPYPIGGRYLKDNLQQSAKFMRTGEYDPAQNPKRFDFQHAFLGHDVPVIDEQMMKAYPVDPNTGKPYLKPPGMSYGAASQAARDVASNLGVTNQELQEVVWHGVKEVPGEPFIETMNKAIERTHRLTGVPRDQVAYAMIAGAKGHYPGGKMPALYARGLLAPQPTPQDRANMLQSLPTVMGNRS